MQATNIAVCLYLVSSSHVSLAVLLNYHFDNHTQALIT
jgi:hypothetical protein